MRRRNSLAPEAGERAERARAGARELAEALAPLVVALPDEGAHRRIRSVLHGRKDYVLLPRVDYLLDTGAPALSVLTAALDYWGFHFHLLRTGSTLEQTRAELREIAEAALGAVS